MVAISSTGNSGSVPACSLYIWLEWKKYSDTLYANNRDGLARLAIITSIRAHTLFHDMRMRKLNSFGMFFIDFFCYNDKENMFATRRAGTSMENARSQQIYGLVILAITFAINGTETPLSIIRMNCVRTR